MSGAAIDKLVGELYETPPDIIAEVRAATRRNESLSDADRTAALKQLDDLSDRLATLTAEK